MLRRTSSLTSLQESAPLGADGGRPASLGWLYVPAVLVLLGVAALCALTGTAPVVFTRDPAAFHEASPFIGSVSNLGVQLWTATAAIALFAAALLRGRSPQREAGALLLHAGLLTAWLALDDLYMFHERIGPDELGLPQPLIFLAYGLWTAAALVRFRAQIVREDRWILGTALACFAASVATDQLAPGWWFDWPYTALLEDGAKLLGIVGWLAWLAGFAGRALRRSMAPAC